MVPTQSDSGSHDSSLDVHFQQALERARGLATVVEGEARACEEAATLTPKVVDAIRDSELMLAFLPKELGGHELPPQHIVQVVEEVSRLDGSTGWCFGMNGLITGVCAAALPQEGLEEIYAGDPTRLLMAGGFPPMGRADREGDAWRVTAHMRFGSGILHADHVACTAVEFAGDTPVMDHGMPRMRTFVVPREEVRIVENWDVAGLQGTGSCDYHLDDQLLPDSKSFIASALVPLRGHSLYSLPLMSIASAPHSGFALGVGRRALEEIGEHAGWRQRLASQSKLAQRKSFQMSFARAKTALDAARALVLANYAELGAAFESADGVQIEDRAKLIAATTNAYEAALDSAQMAFRAGGAAALFRDGRLQRTLRDIQAGAQHIVPSEESWERVGEFWLGAGIPAMI